MKDYLTIDYAKISTPVPGELDEILAECRKQRELREAFPLSEIQRKIHHDLMLNYLEEVDEKLGYGAI